MSTLERAIAIAAEAHAGQIDKGGAPYILHPLRVMLALSTDEERIVAVLHDVLEDCPAWNAQRLIAEGFSPKLVGVLLSLTKRKGEAYSDFIERVKEDPLATRVKLADIRDNSDLTRIPEPTSADYERLRKYDAAFMVLGGRRVSTTSTTSGGFLWLPKP